ncbi:recombinase family protein [Holosporaceae bacterium 'Namur']|nr:recombinase family protein [Holosporaceae bacterium 'Namur']
MLIGYARVSTSDQNLDMQIDALKRAGCGEIFAEKISGTKADRPKYIELKKYVRSGLDTIVVYKLDRLGRSLRHLIDEIGELNSRDVGFKSLQENIDTTTSGGKLFFHIFAAIAEFEKDIIKERTLAGLSAARARGRLGGRPKKLSEPELLMMRRLYADKSNSIDDICKMFKISRSLLFKSVNF